MFPKKESEKGSWKLKMKAKILNINTKPRRLVTL